MKKKFSTAQWLAFKDMKKDLYLFLKLDKIFRNVSSKIEERSF